MFGLIKRIGSGIKKGIKGVLGVLDDKTISVQTGQNGGRVEIISKPPSRIITDTGQQFQDPVQVTDFSGMLPYIVIGGIAYMVLKK